MIILGEKENRENKEIVDKNFFRAMSYELAGEIGIIDNEDMKNNRGLIPTPNKQNQENDK